MKTTNSFETNVKDSNVVSLTTKQLLDLVSLSVDAALSDRDATSPESGYSFSPVELGFLHIVDDDAYANMAKLLNQHIQAIRIGLKWRK